MNKAIKLGHLAISIVSLLLLANSNWFHTLLSSSSCNLLHTTTAASTAAYMYTACFGFTAAFTACCRCDIGVCSI